MKISYKGGTLLTSLFIVCLFSFLFLLTLENFQLTRNFDEKTKSFYLAKIMVKMTINEIEGQKEGSVSFSEGHVEYRKKEDKVLLTVYVMNTEYFFEENLSINKKE